MASCRSSSTGTPTRAGQGREHEEAGQRVDLHQPEPMAPMELHRRPRRTTRNDRYSRRYVLSPAPGGAGLRAAARAPLQDFVSGSSAGRSPRIEDRASGWRPAIRPRAGRAGPPRSAWTIIRTGRTDRSRRRSGRADQRPPRRSTWRGACAGRAVDGVDDEIGPLADTRPVDCAVGRHDDDRIGPARSSSRGVSSRTAPAESRNDGTCGSW